MSRTQRMEFCGGEISELPPPIDVYFRARKRTMWRGVRFEVGPPGSNMFLVNVADYHYTPKTTRSTLPYEVVRSILARVFTTATIAIVFDPLIADLQHEWQEAVVGLSDDDERWVHFRGYLLVALAIVRFILMTVCGR